MRALLIAGVILILGGFTGLVVDYIPIHHQEEVAKIGPITATRDKETDVIVPPLVGVIAILAGAGLVFAGARVRA